jgi:hypothetical protein
MSEVMESDMMPKQVTRAGANMNSLPIILIIGHLLQIKEIEDECFKKSLETVRKFMPLILNTLSATAYELMTMHAQG